MTEAITVSTTLPASPEAVYRAWLDAREHSLFRGAKATVERRVGGKFTAWDGYIQGRTLEVEPDRRIVQSWRTTEFPEGSGDSRLEVLLEAVGAGTRVTLVHTNIPDGQGKEYEQGWLDY